MTKFFDIISVDLWLLVHASSPPTVLLVLIAIITTIVHSNTVVPFLFPKLSLNSCLMNFLNLLIVSLCLLPRYWARRSNCGRKGGLTYIFPKPGQLQSLFRSFPGHQLASRASYPSPRHRPHPHRFFPQSQTQTSHPHLTLVLHVR